MRWLMADLSQHVRFALAKGLFACVLFVLLPAVLEALGVVLTVILGAG